MERSHTRSIGIGLCLATLAPACAAPATTPEPLAVAQQALTTQLAPPFGGNWHQELSVGHSTIVASDTGAYAFYDRNGNALDAGFGTGNVVTGNALFASFFQVSSPLFINKNLPINQAPSPSIPPYETCDATQDAPGDGPPYFTSSCMTHTVYDAHATYDPVHRRFILAGHVRNMNWTFPAPNGSLPNPGQQVDAYSWRYVLFAVSRSENPADGFNFYSAPEYYADWPRVGVSGDYFVVTYHGESSDVDDTKPLVTLYLMDDLAAGLANPRTFTYTQAQLSSFLPYTTADFVAQRVGFLVVPTHDQPPDPGHTLWGTAYVLARSSSAQDLPMLFGFVPGANPSVAPIVIAASMPGAGYEGAGIVSYVGKDPTSASIRGGYLYSVYEDGSNDFVHIDQQLISTTHNGASPPLSLQPTWGANVGPTQPSPFLLQYTAPVVEVTADGSAVLGYSVISGFISTLDVRSTTFLANGVAQPEQAWASGPYTGGQNGIGPVVVNRTSIDPLDPQSVWVLGVEGNGGAGFTPFAQSVSVDSSGCTGATVQNFGIVSGCAGTVTFDARETLCTPGYTVCTAKQWASWTGASTPIANYWTDDNLGFSGTNHACAALTSTTSEGNCGTVLNAKGQAVPSPMRVCVPGGTDQFGNPCNWTGCGLDATSPNQYFGGCFGDSTAGALCCPISLGCANGLPDDVFSTATAINGVAYSETRVVGCGGAVTWDQRASLCGVGYSPCKASQWANVAGTPRPSNDYWTDDNLGFSGTNHACAALTSTTSEGNCGTVLNAQNQPVPAPMRVCTSIGADAYGNACNWTGCGLNSNTNDHFGGCANNATAGTLCCAD